MQRRTSLLQTTDRRRKSRCLVSPTNLQYLLIDRRRRNLRLPLRRPSRSIPRRTVRCSAGSFGVVANQKTASSGDPGENAPKLFELWASVDHVRAGTSSYAHLMRVVIALGG